MGRGRPKDRAPEGFYTTSEAAAVLGVTPTRIRQRIADGTLPIAPQTLIETTEGSYAENRHYIPRDVVDAEAADKARAPLIADVERTTAQETDRGIQEVVRAVEEMFGRTLSASDERLLEGVAQLLEENRERAGEFFPRLFGQLEEYINDQRSQVTDAVEEQMRQVVPRLDALLELQERNARMFEEMKADADAIRAQREEQGPERRSIWRRIFGA